MFASNDLCANGLLEALFRNGIGTPEDLSVVCCDDTRTTALSYMDLTTVHQDAAEMTESAVQLCSERLDEQRTAGKGRRADAGADRPQQRHRPA